MSSEQNEPRPPDAWHERIVELAGEANRGYLVALRATGSHVLAEEAVQDAYARLIERPPRDLGRGPVTGYFLKMVRGIAINSLKSSASRKRRETQRMPRVRPASDIEELHAAREMVDAAKGALARLPSTEREAVSLRCEQGLDLAMISEVLGTPLKTVHGRVKRGLEKLRVSLAGAGFSADIPSDLGETLREGATTNDWTIVRFGQGTRPVAESEWDVELGEWAVDDGAWVATGGYENIISWTVDVPGSFRFICEGWIESEGELSLVGHRSSRESRAFTPYSGYWFEFGAEFRSCTKLARHQHDVLSKIGMAAEPGRRYRLEMEYLDREGQVHCYIDGRRVFSYRELFPFAGTRLGFYAYGAGAHVRPIEIERQDWGVEIPAMRAADRQLQYRNYREALESYRRIAEDAPAPQDALEARAKMGACWAQLSGHKKARTMFASVRDSNLEPFALAEESLALSSTADAGSQRAGLERFGELLRRFPASHAKVRILDACEFMRHDESFAGDALQEGLELRAEFERLGRDAVEQPTHSQLRCQTTRSFLLMRSGRWREALDDLIEFEKRLLPVQSKTIHFRSVRAAVALACGRDDLLPDVFDLPEWNLSTPWHSGVELHCIVRGIGPDRFISEVVERGKTPQRQRTGGADASLVLFFARLAAGRADEAVEMLASFDPDSGESAYRVGSALIEAQLDDALDAWIERVRHVGSDPDGRVVATLSARRAVERRRFDEAARHVEELSPPAIGYTHREGYLLQLMLASLGMPKRPAHESLVEGSARVLAGAEMDLARCFLGSGGSVESVRWPHDLWRPEWRLWLALWLEQRGEYEAARGVASAALDTRYGLTHCQPGLAELCARAAGS